MSAPVRVYRYHHPCSTKEHVRRRLLDDGVEVVLGRVDLTLEDALALLDDQPGKFIGAGPCDNRVDGVCQGHDLAPGFSFAARPLEDGQQDLFGRR